MDKYAVFGNPIAHSKSPEIHQEFAKELGVSLFYDKQKIPLNAFTQAVHLFFKGGGKGLNITTPFKVEAFTLADKLTPAAQISGAVNTLKILENGEILGHNTDGEGLVQDILNLQKWEIEGQKILILGAGGAARGVLYNLLQEKPAKIFIANRTSEKAKRLAEVFIEYGPVSGGGYGDIEDGFFDLVVNATSTSLNGDLPPVPTTTIHEKTNCYDMVYSADLTLFLKWAKERGSLNVADGLGMLVGQAAASFELWSGQKPTISKVVKTIKGSF